MFCVLLEVLRHVRPSQLFGIALQLSIAAHNGKLYAMRYDIGGRTRLLS